MKNRKPISYTDNEIALISSHSLYPRLDFMKPDKDDVFNIISFKMSLMQFRMFRGVDRAT